MHYFVLSIKTITLIEIYKYKQTSKCFQPINQYCMHHLIFTFFFKFCVFIFTKLEDSANASELLITVTGILKSNNHKQFYIYVLFSHKVSIMIEIKYV